MRSCDQADINFVRAVTAEPLKFLLLQDAEQLSLKFERNVADLIKKERALVHKLKTSRFLRDRSGECASFMTEQFALQKSEEDCSAVQFDKPRKAWFVEGQGAPQDSFISNTVVVSIPFAPLPKLLILRYLPHATGAIKGL